MHLGRFLHSNNIFSYLYFVNIFLYVMGQILISKINDKKSHLFVKRGRQMSWINETTN